MIGQTISNYLIVSLLGEGGMGVVYKAEDLKLKRTVALKFLSDKALSDPVAKARMLREAQAAGRLDHPNICHIYDLEEAGGHMFIVMAFIEGNSLAQRLHSAFTLGEALVIAIQIGEGLKAAHAKGVIHRDMKPANILINAEGLAQITDFGLARIEDRSRITRPGTLMGTVSSMSPEQLLAQDADARTDIWGFGAILYELCTGRQPFQRADFEKSMQAILHEEPAAPTSVNPNLPSDLNWILSKALAKPREERYQHVDDLVADLRVLRRNLSPEQADLPTGHAAAADAPTRTIEAKSWLGRLIGKR